MNKNIVNNYQYQSDFDLLMQPYKAAIKIVKTKLEIIDEELKLIYTRALTVLSEDPGSIPSIYVAQNHL